MSVSRTATSIWAVAGALLLLATLGISLLSTRFVFGEGHAERPIPLFLALSLTGWAAYCVASVFAMRGQRVPVGAIVAVGLLARCILLPSNLIQENDCYRYVLDGEALVHGVNPYAFTPEEVADSAPPRFSRCFEREDARRVLSRISYQEVPTLYPPLAQVSFAVGALVRPWDWAGQRYVFLAFDVATMLALLALLRRTGRSTSWLVVYAWNPLVLKEVANAAHLDSLPALCLVLVVVCLANWSEKKQSVWAATAGAVLAAATLAKLYAVVLVPACLAFLWSDRRTWSAIGWFAGTYVLLIVLSYVPFLGVGVGRLTEGLQAYGLEWQRNDGAFRVVEWCCDRVRALLPAYTADRLNGQISGFLLGPRGVAAATVAAYALASAWGLRKGALTLDGLIRAMQTTLLCWFLFLPAAFPWYAVGLVAISALRPRPWMLVLSGAFGMYYLLFLYEYRDFPASWKPLTQAIEHGLVWLTLAVTFAMERFRRNPDTEPAPA